MPVKRLPMVEVERTAKLENKLVEVAFVEVEKIDESLCRVELAVKGVKRPTTVEVGVK